MLTALVDRPASSDAGKPAVTGPAALLTPDRLPRGTQVMPSAVELLSQQALPIGTELLPNKAGLHSMDLCYKCSIAVLLSRAASPLSVPGRSGTQSSTRPLCCPSAAV